VHEFFGAQLCQQAESQLDKKGINQFKSLFILLSMTSEIGHTTIQNEHQWKVNDF
jgi:hypothetical protein